MAMLNSRGFMSTLLLPFGRRLSNWSKEVSEKGSQANVIVQQIHLLPTSRKIENTASLIIVLITSAVAAILPFLPYEEKQGNQVLTFISKHQAWRFHWFIVSNMFAFSGSFASFFLHHSRPKLASFCCFCSVVFAAFVVIMLVSAGC